MYFAPEILKLKSKPKNSKAQTYNCSSDMWSVGVIMFNLLCARNPWTAVEFEKTLEKTPFDIERKDPWPSISPEAKDLLRKLWNPDGSTRLKAKDALLHPWIQNTSLLQKRKRSLDRVDEVAVGLGIEGIVPSLRKKNKV
jgi:calcium-dependent protein kinase